METMKLSDYMSAAPHSAAINVTGSSKVTLMLKPGLPAVQLWPCLRLERWLWSLSLVVLQMKGPLAGRPLRPPANGLLFGQTWTFPCASL